MWEKITFQMRENSYSFNSEQVAGKWKLLLRTYKNVKDHNKKSRSGTKSYGYENELNDILGNDPFINPTFTLIFYKSHIYAHLMHPWPVLLKKIKCKRE